MPRPASHDRLLVPPAREPVEIPYTELAPPPELAAFIDRFWMRASARASDRFTRVLPDGCLDLIVHLDTGHVDTARAEIAGPMTSALVIPDSPAALVAVRFKPGTASAFVGHSLDALTDLQPDAADVGLATDALIAAILEAATPRARLEALAAWVRRRLAGAPRPDRLVARAVARLSSADPPPIDRLARELGVSRQHIARAFRREVGISPKHLALVARMQRAVWAIGRGQVDYARLAVELGYFDQPHLVNDVRALAGATPSALAAEPAVALPHLFDAHLFETRAALVPILQSPLLRVP